MRFEDMTWVEVNELLNQIGVVSTTFVIKEVLGSMFIKEFRRGTEFEEFESKEEQDEADLKKIQRQAIMAGLTPPKAWAK